MTCSSGPYHFFAITSSRCAHNAAACRRPLELDTDGIWCCLPGSFPEEFTFTTADGSKKHKVNYPGLMLNVMCAEHNANPQYHSLETLPNGSQGYTVSSQMSIEFEVDGPYLVRLPPAAMVLFFLWCSFSMVILRFLCRL